MNLLVTVALFAAVGLLPSSCGGVMEPSGIQPPGSCPATTSAPTGSQTQPAPSATQTNANYAGRWSGQYHVIGCSRICGLGPSVCDSLLPPPGASFPLRLTLTQDGRIASGTLDFFNNIGNLIVETGPVTGTIDDADALLLSGTTQTTDPSERSQTTLSDWNSSLAEEGKTIAGRFVQNRSFQNFFGAQQLKIDCELVNFRRAAS
jgi:hypothetical protein